MKLGIYIGSFNPVHLMHEEIVENLLKEKLLDKIVVIPTNDNYHLKKGLVSFYHRFEMLKLALNNENIVISDIEKNEYHYTYENIKILKEKYPLDELYLIIGADNLFEFNTWKNYEKILDSCNLIVYGRNDLNIAYYINNNFTNYKNRFIIKEPLGELSSTLIRNNLKNNKDVKKYLSKPVIEYITKNNLYKGDWSLWILSMIN